MRWLAVGLGCAAVAVPVAAAFAFRPGTGTTSPVQAAPPAATPPARTVHAPPGFPAPPAGAVVFAREQGFDALALGVVPGRRRMIVQTSVLGPQGRGVPGLRVSVAVGRAARSATACGPGCYRATLPVAGRPAAVAVDVAGRVSAHWLVRLPAAWPPAGASALVDRAAAVWRSLRSLAFHERLASGPGQVVISNWQLQAPDRVAYQVKDGADAVIVGPRRWDRMPGSSRWVESPQTPLTQPVPTWVARTDAHVLGEATVDGRRATRISFFDPGTPAWFVIDVDPATMRTLDVHMTTTAHFMHDVFGGYDATPSIEPPG